jgi:hypothetical protein
LGRKPPKAPKEKKAGKEKACKENAVHEIPADAIFGFDASKQKAYLFGFGDSEVLHGMGEALGLLACHCCLERPTRGRVEKVGRGLFDRDSRGRS